MEDRKRGYITIAALLALVISLYWLGSYLSPTRRTPKSKVEIEELVHSAIPENLSSVRYLLPFPYYELIDEAGKIAGYLIYSEDLNTTTRGYGGDVPLVIITDAEGEVKNVVVGENNENPIYLNLIKRGGLFDKLKNYHPTDQTLPDAISGATLTSTALIKGTIDSVQKLYMEVITKRPRWHPRRASGICWSGIYALIILFLGVLFPSFKSFPRYRKYWLIFTALTLGFSLQRYFSIADIVRLISGKFHSGYFLWVWASFVSLVILLTVIWGRVFCWHICPFGAIQDLLHFRKMPLQLPQKITYRVGYAKFILLGFSLFMIAYTSSFNFISYEPFSLMFRPCSWLTAWEYERIPLMVICGSILASLFVYRPWCSFFCPAGAFLNILSRFRISQRLTGCIEDCGRSYTDDNFHCARCPKVNRRGTGS